MSALFLNSCQNHQRSNKRSTGWELCPEVPTSPTEDRDGLLGRQRKTNAEKKCSQGKTEWGIKEGVEGKEALAGNKSGEEEGCWERAREGTCQRPNKHKGRSGAREEPEMRPTETEPNGNRTPPCGEGSAAHSEDQANTSESVLPICPEQGLPRLAISFKTSS